MIMNENTPITYVAFLDGIQQKGKNLISMVQLGYSFHTFSLREEYPYEPTGDVIFVSINPDPTDLAGGVERLVYAVNKLRVKAHVMPASQLGDLIENSKDSDIEIADGFVRKRSDLETLLSLSQSPRPHSHDY